MTCTIFQEISIYFELLPCLRQFCEGTKLEKFMCDRVPACIYGSNNCDGAGVLVFECAQVKMSALGSASLKFLSTFF